MPNARNGDKCMTTGTCDYCPVNARYTATFDLMLLQNENGSKLDLRTEAPVLKIWMDGKKRVRGVRFLNRETGDLERMESDVVVVCSGTVESTKLLLASAGTDWPDGIGNDSGHLGRHLVGHPVFSVSGVRPGNPDRLHQELIGIVSLVSRHFDTPEYQREGKMLFTMSDGSTTPLERHILSNVSRSDIDAKMTSEMPLSLGGAMEQFESPENRVSLGDGTTRHGLATTEIEFGVNEITRRSHQAHTQTLAGVLKAAGCKEDSIRIRLGNPDGAHATSTCRMSSSDSDGVVDRNLQVHGTDNLYVCSNAVFPNVAAANPTLTVAALAVRLAEHVDAA
jgi:choline dehydrogenase-like flavoprotein